MTKSAWPLFFLELSKILENKGDVFSTLTPQNSYGCFFGIASCFPARVGLPNSPGARLEQIHESLRIDPSRGALHWAEKLLKGRCRHRSTPLTL